MNASKNLLKQFLGTLQKPVHKGKPEIQSMTVMSDTEEAIMLSHPLGV